LTGYTIDHTPKLPVLVGTPGNVTTTVSYATETVQEHQTMANKKADCPRLTVTGLVHRRNRFASLTVAILALCFLGSNLTKAQEFDFANLPVLEVNPDFNGVDPASGSFSTASPLVLSAPGAGHLKVQTSFNGRLQTFSLNIHLRDKTYTPGTYSSASERHIKVHVGGTDKLFTCGNIGDCTQVISSDGSQLTRVTTDNYVYTDKFGTVLTFYPLSYQPLPPCNDPDGETGCNAAEYEAFAYVSTIAYSSGEKLAYEPYTTVATEGGQTYARDTIRSNLGYEIVFEETVASGYTASGTAGWNWLNYQYGKIPPKMSLYRGSELIDTLTTTKSQNGNTYTWTQRDDLNRIYRVTFEGGSVSRCSFDILISDSTPLLPVLEVSPGGVTSEVEYHKQSGGPFDGNYSEAAGDGTSIPVKTITRGGNTWTYDNVAGSKTITNPFLVTRTADHVWLNDGYDYGWQPSWCSSGHVSTNITAYEDELNRQADYSYIGELLDVGHLPEDNGYDYDYDARGNLTKITQIAKPASGLSNRVVFQAAYPATCSYPKTCNKPNWVRDAKGNQTDYTYDSVHGGVLTATLPADSNGIRPQNRYTYTPHNTGDGTLYRLTQTSACIAGSSCIGTDDERKTVTTYWNDTFLPATVTETLGDGSLTASASYAYDTAGRPIQVTDPRGNTTTYLHDAVGQRIGTISADPDGSGALPRLATRLTYNDDGQVTKVEEGTTTGTTAANLAAMTVTQSIETTYDSVGRKVQSQAKAGSTTYAVTQYSYDAASRLQCVAVRMNPAAFASPPPSACTLGSAGSYGLDRVTRNVYDVAGQLITVQKAYGTPLQQDYASYAYSENGERKNVTDANGNKASFVYDGYDRLERWNFPSKTTPGQVNTADYEAYGYDANDNRNSLRKRDGQVIGYSHDNLDRVTLKNVSGATNDVYYDYDLRGLQLFARFASGQGITTVYDGLGRAGSSTTSMGGVNRSLTYQYDLNGNRTRITHPDGTYFTYVYDNLDRNEEILQSASNLAGDTAL
jgi:YD repeat-containing protein